MTFNDWAKLIVGVMLALALWLAAKCSHGADVSECRYLANIAAQAVHMHQEYGLSRDRYLVAWLDPDSDWAREGERILDEAFEYEGKPYEFGQQVYDACVGERT